MRIRPLLTVFVSFVLACTAVAPALAGGSIAGGVYTSGGNGTAATGAGVMLSTSNAVPLVPVSVGLTGFAPLARGGGYAVTADGRFALGGDALGVGYGVGQFGGAHSSGVATAFFDHQVAPLTSIELRGYFPTGTHAATAGFLGLKFSL